MLNTQKPQKMVDSPYLELHSIFNTLQGEGIFAGRPATFVRLGGCNLQCPLCDTEYTEGVKRVKVEYVIDWLGKNPIPSNLVVITGGEPFRQNITELCNQLLANGFTVQIETNGTLPPPKDFPISSRYLFVVCSPKTGSVSKDLLPHIDAFKYVVKSGEIDEHTGLPIRALDHTAKPFLARPPAGFNPNNVFIQPADEKDDLRNSINLDAATRCCLLFGYTLCVQLHKLANVE